MRPHLGERGCSHQIGDIDVVNCLGLGTDRDSLRVDQLIHQDRPGGCIDDRYFDDAPVQVGGFGVEDDSDSGF